MTTEAMTFTFDWRPDEQAQVVNVLTREFFDSGVWRIAKWAVMAILAVGILSIGGAVASGQLDTALGMLPWVLLIGLWIVFLAKFNGQLQARQVRRHDPNVDHPFTYTLDDSGLHIALRTTNLELKWEGVHKIREAPNLFMFYYNPRCAYFLPKRAIGDDREVDAVRQWIRSHMPDSMTYQE